MITDEQARASLDRLRVACDQLCEEEDQYEEVRIGRLIEHETDILVEFASQELSRREASRAEPNQSDEWWANRIRQDAMAGLPDSDHLEADAILRELLKSLGFSKTVAAFDSV